MSEETGVDEPAVRALWQTMAEGWGRADAAAFAGVFSADVDFVTVGGEVLFGRTAVEQRHAELFATVFRGTRLEPGLGLIRPLTPQLCLVHATTAIHPVGLVTHAQAVLARRDDGWSIRAFHNMVPHLRRST
ncbi:SgcJ/EcaC family oxidoreductase [Streptomyces sp. NA04227]|uniref:SgcJ/EcaC family oxidoreductase n=1 Tax=Streptomyces sp. NA04227 TaxID=2742136 RepID=UPI0015927E61|nr:SgcJ/EcaC family oxidoreductase [Streptomyces sp. NA04227]QKW09750.1 SgcJ/EcaC family oxidoreductase [Streptomyces sp. NA04227]